MNVSNPRLMHSGELKEMMFRHCVFLPLLEFVVLQGCPVQAGLYPVCPVRGKPESMQPGAA